MVPVQSGPRPIGPVSLRAMSVFVMVTEAEEALAQASAETEPVAGATRLSAIVTLTSVIGPETASGTGRRRGCPTRRSRRRCCRASSTSPTLMMPPPTVLADMPKMMLPLMVECVISSLAKLVSPPPLAVMPVDLLFRTVHPLKASVPAKLAMPPPPPAKLPSMMTSTRVVRAPRLSRRRRRAPPAKRGPRSRGARSGPRSSP